MVRALKEAVIAGRIRCVKGRLILTYSFRTASVRGDSQRLEVYKCRVRSYLSWSPCSPWCVGGESDGFEMHQGIMKGTNGGVYPDHFGEGMRFFNGLIIMGLVLGFPELEYF